MSVDQAEQAGKLPATDTDTSLTLTDIVVPVWRAAKSIIIGAVIVALLTLGVSFLLPVYYKSTARILPESEKNRLARFGQFADVAQLAGVNIGTGEISRLYPVIITSETILRTVLNHSFAGLRFPHGRPLVEYFDYDEDSAEEEIERAVKRMRDLLTTSYENKTGVVTVSLELWEPQLTADVLNFLLNELDIFMRQKRVSNASEQRKWIEERLQQVTNELREAEEILREFREKNRRITDSPQLLLEQERRLREVQVKSTVYIELVKQLELAKIEEVKNIAIVNVMDPAIPAIKKERPKRLLNTAVAFLVALVVLSAFHVARGVYGPHWSAVERALKEAKRR